jgi:hypothetical protein
MSNKTRVISANDLHVIMTQCLDAARDIHIAMCLFSDDHAAQAHLNTAMHSALIGAEQCRQLHKSRKERIAEPSKDEFDDDVKSPGGHGAA